jgi:cytochrome c
MDSFELNKIMGAILGTCLVLLTLNISANALFSPSKPAKQGFAIAVPDGPAEAPGGAPAEKGGPARVGPNLYDVMTRGHATLAGFNYSAGMQALKGHNWNYEELDKFLANPKAMVKGTTMSFAGLSKQSERADVILYLRSLSDNPPPLPQAAAN